LYGSDQITPAIGDFYIWASGGSVALPAARYDYNSDWTPLLTGLSPAGMAASLAALEWHSQASGVLSVSREARLLAASDAEAQKSRKLGGSYSSGAREPRLAFVLLCSSRG